VEFWATWCGPCRVSIPHLTELQAKFKDKDVTMVGVSDETPEIISPFVKEMGAKMNYVVAADTDRKTFASYMEAFEQGGIPTAFVVDKAGKIVWYGHPMGDLETVLEKVIDGKFDMAGYQREQEQHEKNMKEMSDYLDQTLADDYSAAAKKDGARFVENCTSKDLLNQLAWIILTHPRVMHRDTALALNASQKAYKLAEGNDPSITDTYARALFDSGEKGKALQFQKEAVARANDSALKEQLESTLKKYQSEQ